MLPPSELVLDALHAEPRYAYAIILAVAELSDGNVRLRVGTLYPMLDQLTRDGLIEVAREEVVDGRLKRYYRLTPAGTGWLAAVAARDRQPSIAVTRLRTATA